MLKKLFPHILAPVLVIAALLAITATATAAVLIYTNDFSSKGEVQQVKKFNGGKKCNSSWRSKDAFEVLVKSGPKTCVYRTRVENDGSGGNLSIGVKTKLTNATQRKARRESFVGLGVRFGKKDGYLFKVFPNKGKWQLSRKPGSGDFPMTGSEAKIKPVGKTNVLRLQAKGNKITAIVNGAKVVNAFGDGNSGAVGGTKSVMVIGSGKQTNKDVVGFFDDLKVKLP